MTRLDPMAVFYNTPEQLEMLRNFVGETDIRDEVEELKRNIAYMEQAITKKVWDKIYNELLKNIEGTISKEIIKQLNAEKKKASKSRK